MARFLSQGQKHFGLISAIAGVLFVGCALWLVVFSVRDYDTFWHLANGRAMLEQGRIINEEIFSYSAFGTKFPNHSWLAQVILYLFYFAGGTKGLIVYKLLLTAGIVFTCFKLSRLLGAGRLAALFSGYLVVFVGLSRFVVRPQLFSYLGLAILAYLLLGFVRGRLSSRIFWFLPFLMVAWDFLHGAVFGYVFWGSLAAGETAKFFLPGNLRRWQKDYLPTRHQVLRLWGWLFLCLAISLLKPNGIDLYGALLDVAKGNYIFAMTGEFMPTATFGNTFWPFWALLAGVTSLVLVCWRRFDLSLLLILIPFVFLGIRYNRCVAVFAIVAAPVVVALWCDVRARVASRFPPLYLARIGTLALLAGVLWLTVDLKGPPVADGELDPSGVRTGWGMNQAFLPMGAVDFIKTVDLQGNMFNSDRFGGLLAYFLAPQRKIFHYNHPRIFQEIYAYLHNPRARDKWQHKYALVATPEEASMFEARHWITIYRDSISMIMVPNEPQLAEVIKRYGIMYFNPLASAQTVRNQLKNPRIAAVLLQEIANYLKFNRDEKFCQLLVEGLSSSTLSLASEDFIFYTTMALRANSQSPVLLGFMGLQSYRQGNLDTALGYFLSAQKLSPDSYFVQINLGFLYLDLTEPEKAADVFRALRKRDEANLDTLYGLGKAELMSGNPDVGRILLKTYLKKSPSGRFAEKASNALQ